MSDSRPTVSFPKVAQLRSPAELAERVAELGWELPLDPEVLTAAAGSPLAEPLEVGGFRVGNRWCIHPMEGWDAQPDGTPSELTLRRWRNFGRSGAKLIWGGEAAAVQPSGRANPQQTLATPRNKRGLADLLAALRTAHQEHCGTTDDLLVGLQLTHSGRFCKPDDHHRTAPRIAYRHPLLDPKFRIAADDDAVVLADAELDQLADDYLVAARLAADVGFQFVDVKACHGYLLHELLSARTRPGKYGGDFDGRTRLLRDVIGRIRQELPQMMVGVRLSVFDVPPYRSGRDVGQPMDFQQLLPYPYAFGANPDNPLEYDLAEPLELLRRLRAEGVALVNLSCGSPYYNPHIQRPAAFPPSDGYLPPEDPLVGVCRQLAVVRACKQQLPDLPIVGSGYSYLQDYLPHVGQAAVRDGWVDFVGLGRMVLSYPELPHDALATGKLRRKLVCRTFSECTTAPRHAMVSGCYPLDPFYKERPERQRVLQIKKEAEV